MTEGNLRATATVATGIAAPTALAVQRAVLVAVLDVARDDREHVFGAEITADVELHRVVDDRSGTPTFGEKQLLQLMVDSRSSFPP